MITCIFGPAKYDHLKFRKSRIGVLVFHLKFSKLLRYLFAGFIFILQLYTSACDTVPTQNNEIINTPTISQSLAASQTPTISQTKDVTKNDGITVEEDSLIPPIPPSQLRANVLDNSVELRWIGTGSDIDVHYIVYRRFSDSNDWEEIALIPVQDRNRGEYIFNDYTIEGGHSYEYAIKVFDHYGKESILSEIVRVEIKP